jgi:hypothetical protein
MQEELLDIDFDKCRELERERLRAMSDVPALRKFMTCSKSMCVLLNCSPSWKTWAASATAKVMATLSEQQK